MSPYIAEKKLMLDDGTLVCNLHDGANWCDCIQEAVKESNDWKIIFGESDPKVGFPLTVPVIPSVMIWQEVTLGSEVREHMRPVFLDISGTEHRIGTVVKGEGLLVLRSLIWEYTSTLKPAKDCTASLLHEYAYNEMLRTALDKQQAQANNYTMRVHSTCLFCYLKKIDSANFTDDVPEI